ATATTNLRAAERMYAAYRDLYDNKAVSRDQVDQAQARYQQAKGTYEQARLAQSSLSGQLSRSHEVLEDNLVSAREGLAQAQAQLVAAQVESGSGDVAAAHAEATRAAAEYSFARAQAGAMQIRAPYDATVLSVAPERNDPLRPLQPGDSVDAGQAILTLAAPRGFIVRTKVDEHDVINVRLGERAQITGEDFPGRTLAGRVVEISPIAQRADSAAAGSRTVATTIAIDRPPAYLRDGMSADVKIFTTDLPRALAVPNDAIVRDGEASYVFVVSGARAHRQAVRAGAANETNSLILSGLRAGDIVVAPSIAGLDDGNPVSFAASPEPVR
ncbi:MAG TPA: efflux RND transporter periplasmic adaptor subunit, partial [Candidatus Nitrosotalea sp.]|nr:efflux RND transporter periplasmic adaptor subunit [Candidatus Nitrosotalea sp.]